MFFESWKKALVALVLCCAVIGAVWFVLANVSFPEYTNMSDEQANAQTDRWFSAQANACQQAGGEWDVGFSSADCTVVYTPPDTSWYVTPKPNGQWDAWQFESAGILTIAILAVIAGFGFFLDFIYFGSLACFRSFRALFLRSATAAETE